MFNRKKKEIARLRAQLQDTEDRLACSRETNGKLAAENEQLSRKISTEETKSESLRSELEYQIRRIQDLGKYYETPEETGGALDVVSIDLLDINVGAVSPDRMVGDVLNHFRRHVLVQIADALVSKALVQFKVEEDPRRMQSRLTARLYAAPWDKVANGRNHVVYLSKFH